MIDWFEYDNLLKIGFLNNSEWSEHRFTWDLKEKLEKYKENFDVVITDDGDMELVNELLKNIVK